MPLPVVEVAVTVLRAPDGRVLLAERKPGQQGAGFWELPGGKIDAGETPLAGAVREMQEEVGVTPRGLRPWLHYAHDFRTKRVHLHFFQADGWDGTPSGREGQRIAWVDPANAAGPVLPSNERALRALALPDRYLVLRGAPQDELAALPAVLRAGARLIELCAPFLPPDQRIAYARRVVAMAAPYGARVLLCGSALEAQRAGAAGVHSDAAALRRLTARPACGVWVAACHNDADLAHAVALGAEAVVISPVLACSSGQGRAVLGWAGFAKLAAAAPVAAYAQGGMTEACLAVAKRAGAHGVAMGTAAFISQVN